MIRASKRFLARWPGRLRADDLTDIVLQPQLRALIEAPLVESEGSLLLEPLKAVAPTLSSFQDRTGHEAFVNKIHIDDFFDQMDDDEMRLNELIRQGVKAAVVLSKRLEAFGSYRVFLSLDADLAAMTLRFFERRGGEQWGADDPEAFQLEEVLIIDTEA